jgi:hypothetical protein
MEIINTDLLPAFDGLFDLRRSEAAVQAKQRTILAILASICRLDHIDQSDVVGKWRFYIVEDCL